LQIRLQHLSTSNPPPPQQVPTTCPPCLLAVPRASAPAPQATAVAPTTASALHAPGVLTSARPAPPDAPTVSARITPHEPQACWENLAHAASQTCRTPKKLHNAACATACRLRCRCGGTKCAVPKILPCQHNMTGTAQPCQTHKLHQQL
jgi:hypothetical protein